VKNINKELGPLLLRCRKEKGLTLEQLAKVTGVSKSFIGRTERGERYPSAFVLVKLAEPLGFSKLGLLKIAGILPEDLIDDQISRFKKKMTGTVLDNAMSFMKEINSL